MAKLNDERAAAVRLSLFISATEYRNANRIVPRGGITIRAWKRWCFPRTGTIVPLRRREKGENVGQEEGKREEVNQFESPGSDPAARERSVGQIAPYSFDYGPIRYTGRKARSRTCVRNGDSEISRAGFSGVSTGRMCMASREDCPLRNENAAAVASTTLTPKRCDENIFSEFLRQYKEKLEANSRQKIMIHKKREKNKSIFLLFFSYFFHKFFFKI